MSQWTSLLLPVSRSTRLLTLTGLGMLFLCSSGWAQEKILVKADFSSIGDEASQKVGLGVNHFSDAPEIGDSLADLNVKCLRYATNGHVLFDSRTPEAFQVAVSDFNLWHVKGFSDGKRWFGKLSFDDFIALCRKVNAEPCMVVAVDAIVYEGSADHVDPQTVLDSAVDWVRYANVTRKYGVRYWEIGNENDLSGQGKAAEWSASKYASTVVQFSKAMKAVDPTIQIGANGMRVGNTDTWWDEVLPIAADELDFLITHQYSWIASYDQWRVDPYRYDYNITDAAAAIKRHGLNLPILVTEISGFNPAKKQPHSAWKAFHSFEVIGQALSHREVDSIFVWTAKWFGANDMSTDVNVLTDKNELTPLGQALKIWAQTGQVSVHECPNASGTRSWAVRGDAGQNVVYVLNKAAHAAQVTVALDGLPPGTSAAPSVIYTAASPDATKIDESPLEVKSPAAGGMVIDLPPMSLAMLNLTSP